METKVNPLLIFEDVPPISISRIILLDQQSAFHEVYMKTFNELKTTYFNECYGSFCIILTTYMYTTISAKHIWESYVHCLPLWCNYHFGDNSGSYTIFKYNGEKSKRVGHIFLKHGEKIKKRTYFVKYLLNNYTHLFTPCSKEGNQKLLKLFQNDICIS